MTVEDRLLEVARSKLNEQRLFAELQTISSIKSDRWKNVAHKRQRATSEMIEWACQRWPEMAYWIATGYDPSSTEHSTPEKQKNKKYEIRTVFKKQPKDWTTEEFEFVTSTTFNAYEHKFENPEAILRSTFIWHNAYKNKKTIEETLNEFNEKMSDEDWKTIREGIEGLYEMGVEIPSYGWKK